MTIEWAPLNVPLHRRIETLVAGSWMILIVFGELIVLLAFLATLAFGNMYIRALGLLYIAFMYYDRRIGEIGGRGQGWVEFSRAPQRLLAEFYLTLVCAINLFFRTQWVRSLSYFRYFKNYFPVNVIKTCDLSPDRNYMFGLFPHGLLRWVKSNGDLSRWTRSHRR